MSCFFCNSVIHLSQNCNIYISDVDRKAVARSKKCCINCLTTLEENNVEEKSCIFCMDGKKENKCYLCFSKDHNTVFCPDRFTAINFFIPNVDQVLFPRFMKFLTSEEQHILAFSSPTTFNCIPQKSFKVISTVLIGTYGSDKIEYRENTVVTYMLLFKNQYSESSASLLNKFIFKADRVILKSSTVSSEDFYSTLSSKTTYIGCSNLKFISTVSFSEVLKKCPNVQHIGLHETKVKINDIWPNDFNKRRSTNKPIEIVLIIDGESWASVVKKIQDLNIDFEACALIIKRKPITSNVTISLKFQTLSDCKLFGIQEMMKYLKEILLKYFFPLPAFTDENNMSVFQIQFYENVHQLKYSEKFMPK